MKITDKWTRSEYHNLAVLSDRKNAKLPLFTFQFPLYLSPYRINSKSFIKECVKAAAVDRHWWHKESNQNVLWGSSAGAGLKGYSVDATEENEDLIAHIPSMYGVAPFNKNIEKEVIRAIKKQPEVYFSIDEIMIPWRRSVLHPNWKPKAVQGIDLSPLLFGLAALHPQLGIRFFEEKTQLTYKK